MSKSTKATAFAQIRLVRILSFDADAFRVFCRFSRIFHTGKYITVKS